MAPMTDPRDELAALDVQLGRAWAKVEILAGLAAAGSGLLLAIWHLNTAADFTPWGFLAAGLALFVLGGYLALAGHRSHLYRWNNRNTVHLIDEIRRLHRKDPTP